MIPKVKYYGPRIPSTYAVNLTAAASGSNGITVADDDDIDFGTGDFFLHLEGSLPDWTPATTQTLLRKFVSAGYLATLTSAGLFRVQIVTGTTYASTAPVAITDGANAKLTAVIVRETASTAGSVVFYVNGIQLGASVAIAAASPATINNSDPLYISGTSTARTASNTISCIVGNFAPTAAEVLDLCTNGIPASWKWGSQAAVYTSNFSAGVDGWSVDSGRSIAGNKDGIGGEDDWATVTRTDPSSAIIRAWRAFTEGHIGNISVKAFVPSGATYAGIGLFSYAPVAGNAATKYTLIAANSSGTVTASAISSATSGRWYIGAVDSSGNLVTVAQNQNFSFKNFTFTRGGATMALLPDTIPTSSATTWSDTSGNTGGGTLPAAGATKVTIRR